MICIVTVYKSPNFGSYLQAKALRDILLRYDKDVYLLDGNFRPWIYMFQINKILSSMRHLKFKDAWYVVNKIIQNYRLWKSLPSITLRKANSINNVIFVLGSDEIWNLSRKDCQNPLYWGNGLKGRYFSFSPSINTATLDDLRSFNYVKHSMDEISAISVRDSYSKKVLSAITNKPIAITLDPTLMFGHDYYSDLSIKKPDYNFIALYLFTVNMNDDDVENIKRFAREKQLKLVSLSQDIAWCDINLNIRNGNPFLYYEFADYIITNTFHGTAFAINFSNKFVCMANKGKVAEILEQFGLLEQIAVGLDYNSFKDKLESKTVNTVEVERKKELLRIISLDYINDSIEKIRK